MCHHRRTHQYPSVYANTKYTSGGIKEAVVNSAAEGTYTYKHLFE